MPTYDYKCQACGHAFEELQSFSAPVLTRCPACKKDKLERLFGGGGAIIFKGSGFYETDYRKDSYKDAAKKDEAAAKPAEAKSETKADAPAATESKPAAKPKKGKTE
jgi:putative FmdB family regulatory protein